jgi:hypothetical protein
MASPIIYFDNFISELKSTNPSITLEELRAELFKNSIMTKFYENDQLLLIYHKFDIPSNTKLEKICRSLVVDITDFKVKSFSCTNPVCNREAQQILLNTMTTQSITFNKCYEGSLMSLFNYNDKWYLSTRRCLDASESIWNGKSHREMFLDVLHDEELDFDNFCEQLDKTKGYYFVLIHHHLENIVKYQTIFGENYKKLCLAFVRDSETQEEIYDYVLPEFKNIFLPEEISIEEFDEENKIINPDIISEGVITKLTIDGECYLLKLQNLSYQFSKALGPESNIYKGYIYLYQIGKLKDYISRYNGHKNYNTIINPYNTSEMFDTIGVVDAAFKVLTSELFELFKMLWNFKTSEHLNPALYQILPKEYKDVLFGLRGIYFQLKNKNMKEQTKFYFGVKDIYNYLKRIDIEHFCALLRQRKLMFNWIVNSGINSNAELKNFKKISDKCDIVHLKLIAIYINKLFPVILSSDLPNIVLQI